MPNWTNEQRAAIDARNHTILVSAAAGSGKTAVLVERIVQLVREGYRLSRMLIVTFTRAAAGEMRQRLGQRLAREADGDPERFSQALDELESADISTIHAFCQRVLRREFQAVAIDPLARVCDEQLRKSLFEEALRDSLNELLESGGSEDFHRLADSFDLPRLGAMCEAIYPFLMSMPDPFRWLDLHVENADAPWHSHMWFRALLSQSRLTLQGLRTCLDAQRDMFDEPCAVQKLRVTWEADRALCHQLLERMDAGADEAVQALRTTGFVRAAVCRGLSEDEKAWKDRYDALRKTMKDTVAAATEALGADEESVHQDLMVIRSCLGGLSQLLKTLHTRFMALKDAHHVLDFSDMEQLTLRVMRDENCRASIQREYDHIFVDECQDVSAVQDAIIQSLHGGENCLFMVGDVKQSIYRFRLADPTLFLHRMRTFSDSEDAAERRIFLQRNFRSRASVLDATNRVFRACMQRSVTELDYLPEDELICGRDTQGDPPVEIRLVSAREDGRSDGESLRLEADAVARRIHALQGEGYSYRDMVILLQKTAMVGAKLTEMLQERGVPVFFDGADSYYDLPEIRTVTAMLTVIDNPLQDVPLLTTLRALPFRMEDGELADIRSAKTGRDVPFHEAFACCCEREGALGERCREVRRRLEAWRLLSDSMHLNDFVWFIVRDSGLYASCGALPEGALRQANLRLLSQKAAEYESVQHEGLSGFLRQIDLEMRQSDSRGARLLSENENLVRIMTMHKSKGLEFPVVFLMRLSQSIAGRNAQAVQAHPLLGVSLPYVNRSLSIRRDSPGAAAFAGQKRLDEMAERCRLLYVAMTRARERLILTACCKGEEPSWRMPRGAFRVSQARSMLDWVMQAVCDAQDDASVPWRVIVGEADQVAPEEIARPGRELEAWLRRLLASPGSPSVPAWWNEPPRAEAHQSLKTSVTSLVRQRLFADAVPETIEETPDTKRADGETTMPLRLSDVPDRPAFLQEKHVTGADVGTAMHRLLSLTELAPLRPLHGAPLKDELRAQLQSLTALGCFTAQESAVISVEAVAAFYESELGQRVLHAGRVEREWSFNLLVQGSQELLLQGVIDCAFLENGAWHVLDYKTDRVTDEDAFVARHCMQLAWYARALREISGVPVKEAWLYALRTGKAYEISCGDEDTEEGAPLAETRHTKG